MTTLPFGSWPSPISARHLVEESVGLSDLDVVDGDLVWAELRPSDGGRVVVVRSAPDGAPVDLLPAPFSARSRVHEYGGAPFVVAGDTCWFVNFSDQRIWWTVKGDPPLPLTPESAPGHQVRYADLVIDAGRTCLYAVRERHGVGGLEGAEGVVNDLVWIATDGSGIGVVAEGRDFYAAPRLSPDGSRLVYLSWDLPNMPWDASVLSSITLAFPGIARRVAGGPTEAVSQPRFSPDGTLHYLSDRSGYTSLYREGGDSVVEIGADLSGPDWVFGQSSYTFCHDGSVVVAVETSLGATLTRFGNGGSRSLTDRFANASSLRAIPGGVAAIVGSATEAAAVACIDLSTGTTRIVRASREVPIDARFISRPEALDVVVDGRVVHAIYYPPCHPDARAPESERPPLVVTSHGGPTSRSTAGFNLRTLFFTSRGIAVVDVNYGGSSGFGRAYRERLDGAWGVVDVADCVAVAEALIERGEVDPDRVAIRGGSAGGYTTLCALAFTELFAVGASHYGVSDLASLARDTHKFESRYLDRLVGPLPETEAIYVARSPLLHADEITCPVIFFQGLDDAIVPPQQSEVIVDALRERGVPVAYVVLEGEGHGFRRADSIVRVAESELAFFGAALGFTPDGPTTDVAIDNRRALGERPSRPT